MAIYVRTSRPRSMVRKIRELISEDEIMAWEIDEDNDFTHSSVQWGGLAWIHPIIEEERVVFSIIGAQSNPLTRITYGIYMGRFLECLIIHMTSFIQSIRVSPYPSDKYDVFK